MEERRNTVIQDLKLKLDNPFIVKKSKNHLSKLNRNDPIRKILKTNEKTLKTTILMNKKLLEILNRSDFDRPILMHDKLDYIWENGN